MRTKAWGMIFSLSTMLGVSACSNTVHTVHEDDDEDILFGHTSTSIARKTAKVPKALSMKHPPQTQVQQASFTMPSSKSLVQDKAFDHSVRVSSSELRLIADRIFRNEGGNQVSNLVHWNNGENFASMGIGHFTWYPAGRRARFGNTFPGLLHYMESNGVHLPTWLQKARHQGAPWRTRTELARAKNSSQVKELQQLLYRTRMLQAAYIVKRTQKALPRLVKTAPPHLRQRVAQNLNAVANTPGGWYVLVDYVNFKGEGLNRSGGYKGQNWGLLQVLEDMRPSKPGKGALNEFANAATRVLVRRVRNAPPARNEARWLAGWSNRINTYRHPDV